MSSQALLEQADERIETALKELADIDFETCFHTLLSTFAEPQKNSAPFCNSMTNLLVSSY